MVVSGRRGNLQENMENNFHEVNYLFELHDQLSSYPKGVIRISERIKGTAFFPGGYGLWNTQPDKPLPPDANRWSYDSRS